MQPIELDPEGVPRFKANKIVELLLEAGPFDLNSLRSMPWDPADYTQLMQLIGYSVDGYGELSTSPPELVAEADRKAAELLKRTKS